MTDQSKKILLKIYIGEGYFTKAMPIYQEIVLEAKQRGLAGATVIKCDSGFGHLHVMQQKDSDKNHDLPVLVEIIDDAEKINQFIPRAKELLGNHGMMAMCDITVLHQAKSAS